MITEYDAKKIAYQYIKELEGKLGELLMLADTETIEKPFGWIFFYNSKDYLETGELSYMLAGNAPFIVDKENGQLHVTGTDQSIEHYISEYEKQRSILG
ncbi:MAG: YrhB domain-containing protein [Methylococcaceae bacterium]